MAFLAAFLVTCLKTFVVTLLWGWFLVPLGVKPIGFWHGMGIVALCTVFRLYVSPKDIKDGLKMREEGTYEPMLFASVAINAGLVIIVLVLAAIYHYFMGSL